MPETETLPAEPKPDSGQPVAPQGPPPGSFQNISEQLYGATDAWKRSAAKVREGLERKSEATEPLIASAETELKAPRPSPPSPPSLPAPPSRQLTEFLAPVEGESPTTSITKFLQAVGLFATGISGAARGDARAGLAAFTGAMKGWQEGDIIRADRHFADWEAKTHTALTKWKTERQTYQDIMEAANLSLDQRFKLVHLAALREENKMLADVAEKGDLETLIKILGQQESHADSVQLRMATIIQAKSKNEEDVRQRELDRAERAREADQRYAEKVREFNEKRSEDAAGGGFTPEALEFMAQQYYINGTLPPMGMGKASTQARSQILNRAAQIAQGAGTTPGDQVARAQFAKATQGELTRLMSQRGLMMAFASTAEQNLDAALAISDKVDRTGTPVLNRWILNGRRQIEGDPDVTQLHIFTDRAVTEIARLTSSATGGGVSTDSARREAAQLLSTADTKEQFRRAVESLRKEVDFRRKGYEEQIKQTQNAVKGLTSDKPGTMPAPPPLEGKVRVRRKSDGKPGTIDQKDMSDLYEVIK